jgi:RNA polymerase sigma factor (sigma-70 family)
MESTSVCNDLIEKDYRKNFSKYVLQMTFRAGSVADAEDIINDAYERAIRYSNSFKEDGDYNTWFGRIRYNCLKDHRKKERGVAVVEFDEYDFEGTDCTQFTDEQRVQIQKLLETKSPEQQEILHLHFNLNYSAMDVCAVLGTLYPATHQCIRRFREELKEEHV